MAAPNQKSTYRQPIDARPLTERTTTKLSLGSTRSTGEFDDYELPDEFDDVDAPAPNTRRKQSRSPKNR